MKLVRRIVIFFDIFICTLFGYIILLIGLKPKSICVCLHCVDGNGYEAIPLNKLNVLYQDFKKLYGSEIDLESIIQGSSGFCFTFDDGCGGWKKFDGGSYAISTDSLVQCCGFSEDDLIDKKTHDHLCDHSATIYDANFWEYATKFRKGRIIVLPFGGANYFLRRSLLKWTPALDLVTTIPSGILKGFVLYRGLDEMLQRQSIRLVPRTSYYQGDNFFSLIGRSMSASFFIQVWMQGPR